MLTVLTLTIFLRSLNNNCDLLFISLYLQSKDTGLGIAKLNDFAQKCSKHFKFANI
jgi:hypothetical protein